MKNKSSIIFINFLFILFCCSKALNHEIKLAQEENSKPINTSITIEQKNILEALSNFNDKELNSCIEKYKSDHLNSYINKLTKIKVKFKMDMDDLGVYNVDDNIDINSLKETNLQKFDQYKNGHSWWLNNYLPFLEEAVRSEKNKREEIKNKTKTCTIL